MFPPEQRRCRENQRNIKGPGVGERLLRPQLALQNMDPELFMECEEEELEPWQQVDDSVEEDDVEFMDHYGEPGTPGRAEWAGIIQ
ncbi:hypothetical protein GOODEAATRI_018775 [Goodea atripinnis]|uniref:Uncharacterized protein n=1 Tax=Goodea atripinnis TaxID=208336 RepID=A0ABV0MIZ7_9TELE